MIERAIQRVEQGWVVGFQDEVWWSRVAQPRMHAWAESGQPLRLLEFDPDKKDPDPVALCCYGLLRDDTGQMLLRFVEGRAVSHVTTAYLDWDWVCEVMAEEGRRVLVLIWDNASWHISREVMSWIRAHNRQALAQRRQGMVGVQIIPCFLPSKSPWLNSIEPKWVHGKRAVVEPTAKLTAQHLTQRVCDYYGCDHLEYLKQNVS